MGTRLYFFEVREGSLGKAADLSELLRVLVERWQQCEAKFTSLDLRWQGFDRRITAHGWELRRYHVGGLPLSTFLK